MLPTASYSLGAYWAHCYSGGKTCPCPLLSHQFWTAVRYEPKILSAAVSRVFVYVQTAVFTSAKSVKYVKFLRHGRKQTSRIQPLTSDFFGRTAIATYYQVIPCSLACKHGPARDYIDCRGAQQSASCTALHCADCKSGLGYRGGNGAKCRIW